MISQQPGQQKVARGVGQLPVELLGRNVGEDARCGPFFASLRLLGTLPEPGRGAGCALLRAAEHVRVPADHLGGDGVDDVVEGEGVLLLGHTRVIDDLEQEIPQLVLEVGDIVFRDGIGHLVGLLDGVGRDRRKRLLEVPGAARAGRAQRGHHGEELGNRLLAAVVVHLRSSPLEWVRAGAGARGPRAVPGAI